MLAKFDAAHESRSTYHYIISAYAGGSLFEGLKGQKG